MRRLPIILSLVSFTVLAEPEYSDGPGWEQHIYYGEDFETDFGVYGTNKPLLYVSEAVGDVFQPSGCLAKGPFLDFFGKGELQVSVDLEVTTGAGPRKRPTKRYDHVGSMFAELQLVESGRVLRSQKLYYQWENGSLLQDKGNTSGNRILITPYDKPLLAWEGSEPRNVELRICNVRFVNWRSTRQSRWKIFLNQAKFRWNIID